MNTDNIYDNADAYQSRCYETVTLPNGGVVQLDKLAFDAFKGQCRSTRKQNGKYVWSATLYFDDNTIETASVNNTNIELR